MMKFLLQSLVLFTSITFLSGCVPLISAGASTAVTAISVENDRRTSGEIVDDKTLNLRLLTWSSSNEAVSQSNISYLVFKKSILVAGQVPDAKTKSLILSEIQSKFTEANRVIDEISISKNISFIDKAKDVAITGLIEASLFNQEVVNPTHIRVMTENGVVYLMGDVMKREADSAVKVASSVNGVKSIIKHFNYLTTRPKSEILKEKERALKLEQEKLKALSENEREEKRQNLLKQLQELGSPEGTPF